MEKPLKIFDEQRLKEYCFWLLSRRDYSEKMLFQKMKKYQPDEAIINSVLNFLSANKYIDDKRYSENLLSSYSKRESPQKTKSRLFQKGISKDVIEETVSSFKDDAHEEKICEELLNKKFKIYQKDLYQKYVHFLARKGFSFSNINKAISSFKEGTETF